MPNKHTPYDPKDQRTRRAKQRKENQTLRGSTKFTKGSGNRHNGAPISQSGRPARRSR